MKYLFCILTIFFILFYSCKDNKNTTTNSFYQVSFDLEDYNYINVGDNQKMAYLDLGDKNGETILLIHGEPNYSYVYRDIAPKLAENGYRVIIPDLIGFGYSSKPEYENIITYSNHTKWLSEFITKLSLKNINLFAHDWGAMLSLRIIAKQPQRFNKVAISYGYLFEGTEIIPKSFEGFKSYAKNDSTFLAGNIMNWGSNKTLSDSVIQKYNDPFKTESDMFAVRKFPSLIPTSEIDKEAIINQKLNIKLADFEKPFITIWGNHKDPMWIGKDSLLQANIKGAKNQNHYTLKSNHFIQEDQPEELTTILMAFFN